MTAWQPLLSGELLERAQEALEEITGALAAGAPPRAAEGWSPEDVRKRVACLGDGYAGQALYFGYLYQVDPRQRYADLGLELLDRAIVTVSAEPMAPSLYSGFTGITWVANHLAGRLYSPGGEDPYLQADEALTAYVRDIREPCNYDLISGLVGLGIYALERLPHGGGRPLLEAIVAKLAEAAEETSAGITWVTPVPFLGDPWREYGTEGVHNLGMAHGVPGVVGLLAELRSAGIAGPEVDLLLEGAVAWILDQSLPEGFLSRFPNWRVPGYEASHSRLAWCYGDPGVAAALLLAAQAADRADWQKEALTTAHGMASRPLESTGLRDACLCHGTCGVAHIFNRLYQATGAEELRRAALFYFERLLAERQPGRGYGGFLFEDVNEETKQFVKDPTLLNGSAGVGLTLLAATTAIEPAWDRVLLTNVRLRA